MNLAEEKKVQESFAFPLSDGQKRLWILSQFPGANEAYNIMGALEIKGIFNFDIFKKCIKLMVDRHESLRNF